MPELPEVEHFRHILQPLVGAGPIILEFPPPLPMNMINKKRFPSSHTVHAINRAQYEVVNVLRKGKVICIVLSREMTNDDDVDEVEEEENNVGIEDENNCTQLTGNESTIFLSLHMGMTGRISSSTIMPQLESLSGDDAYPPPHTHLIIRAVNNDTEVAFSDPRRFGSVLVDLPPSPQPLGLNIDYYNNIPTFQDIAPDALDTLLELSSCDHHRQSSKTITEIKQQLMSKKKGIKGLLLDQRAVISGVGNWVADELLYTCHIHPDQTYLTENEVKQIMTELHTILTTAIQCLIEGIEFPNDWLFHRRWRNGGGNKNASSIKDANGRTIVFIQSGGRSTALVPSVQKIVNRTRSVTTTSCHTKKMKKKKMVVQEQPIVDDATTSSKTNTSRKEKIKTSSVDGGATLQPKSLPTRRSKRLCTT
jgi:formamidopyrimidine-DNA glycosylase